MFIEHERVVEKAKTFAALHALESFADDSRR